MKAANRGRIMKRPRARSYEILFVTYCLTTLRQTGSTATNSGAGDAISLTPSLSHNDTSEEHISTSNVSNLTDTDANSLFDSDFSTESEGNLTDAHQDTTGQENECAVPRSASDLKKLLQELEESDYGGYGSWGNFGSGPRWGPPISTRAAARERGPAPGQRSPNGDAYEIEGGSEMDEPDEGYGKPPIDWNQRVGAWQPSGSAPVQPPPAQPQPFVKPPQQQRQQRQQGSPIPPVPSQLTPGQLATIAVNQLDLDYSSKLIDFSTTPSPSDRKIISLRSCWRLLCIASVGAVGAYVSVSPRGAPREVYHEQFRRNFLLFGASLIGPAVFGIFLLDSTSAPINRLIAVFCTAFVWGYPIAWILEAALGTVCRLLVLAVFEPAAFKLCPDVPAPWLPWVLADHGYRPGPVTRLAGDMAVACLAAPFVEELIKVWLARRAKGLPARKTGGANDDAAKTLGPPIHVHTYLSSVMVASLGLKAADNARRVFMYTKDRHKNKFAFAIARGFFPLHELCAGLTAMNLARREILGEKVSWTRTYLPAMALHAWANLRGTQPLLKWRAESPWLELQLQAFKFPRNLSIAQYVQRCLASLVWVSILLKVTATIIKNYWRLKRLHNTRLRQLLQSRER